MTSAVRPPCLGIPALGSSWGRIQPPFNLFLSTFSENRLTCWSSPIQLRLAVFCPDPATYETMAMTSVRLLAGVLRKPDAWVGLWGVLRGAPSLQLCAPWNQYLHFSSTQFSASTYKTLFHHIFSLRFSRLSLSPECIFPFSVRLKSNLSSKKSSRKAMQKVEEEDSDEESSQAEPREQQEELEGDPSVVRDYKDLEKAVQSFRYDVILKTGLDIGRNKVEDAFYKGELRLNGEKLWKKSRTVKVGDTLDLLIGEDKEAETETVMRIVLQKVFEEKTESEKYRVVLRRWKRLQLSKKTGSK